MSLGFGESVQALTPDPKFFSLTNSNGTPASSYLGSVRQTLSLNVSGLGLSKVATSGLFADLLGVPTFARVAYTGAYSSLSGLPTLFDGAWGSLAGKPSFSTVALSGAYSDLSGLPTLFNGAYSSLTGTPTLATVATSGQYSDLLGLPTLFNGAYSSLTGVPTFATVASSGQYADLLGKPALFSGAYSSLTGVPTFATVATTGQYSDLLGKPTLFSGSYTDLSNKPTLFSGAYSALTGVPTFATVATSGSYNDLNNKPAAQVSSDWNASSGVAQILNKPTIPASQVSSDWNASSGVAQILNKPTIPAAQIQSDWNQATTTSLDYIKNKPTIPTAQVNSDWNATSGLSQILNKPTLATVATSGSYTDLSNTPVTFNPGVHRYNYYTSSALAVFQGLGPGYILLASQSNDGGHTGALVLRGQMGQWNTGQGCSFEVTIIARDAGTNNIPYVSGFVSGGNPTSAIDIVVNATGSGYGSAVFYVYLQVTLGTYGYYDIWMDSQSGGNAWTLSAPSTEPTVLVKTPSGTTVISSLYFQLLKQCAFGQSGTVTFSSLVSSSTYVGISGTSNPSWAFNYVDGLTYKSLIFGNANGTNNSAEVSYNHVGDGSAANYAGLGFYGNTNKLVVQAGGNVGIGLTNPSAPLHVNTTGTYGIISSGSVWGHRIVYGNYGVSSYQDGANFYYLITNSGDQYGSYNGLRPFNFSLSTGYVTLGNGATISGGFTANGGSTLTGGVGIGITNPTYPLCVARTGITPAIMTTNGAGSYSSGPRIQTYDLVANGLAWMGLGTDMAGGPYEHSLYFPYGGNTGRCTIGTYDGTTYSTKVTFLSTGNVGIGTASPLSRFTIKNGYNDGGAGGLCIDASDGSVYNMQLCSYVQGSYQVAYKFIINNVAASTVGLYLGYNGYIGIFNSSPAYPLHVSGEIRSTTNVRAGSLIVQGGGSWEAGSIYSDTNWGTLNRAYQASPALAQFAWYTSDGVTQMMQLSPSYHLGIGTSSIESRLHVYNGDGSYATFGPNATWGAKLRVGAGTGYTQGTSQVASIMVTNGNLHVDCASGYALYLNYFSTGTPGAGSTINMYGGVYTNSSITAAADITAFSDIRHKANLEIINNALDKVSSLNGYTFTRTDLYDKETRHTGVIAQEVLEVLPEAILTNKEGIHSVAYGNLAGLFIEALKEERAKREALEERLSILEKLLTKQ